jgi:hypothetical protein
MATTSFFTDAQALEWFDLKGIGKAPARLDMKKLDSVASWHIARMEDARLCIRGRGFPRPDRRPPLSQAQKDGLRLRCIASRIAPAPCPTLMKRPSSYWPNARSSRTRNPPRRWMMYPVVYCQN